MPDFPRPREEAPSSGRRPATATRGTTACSATAATGVRLPGRPRATLRLADGKTFTVTAKGLSKENKYVKSVALNGRPVTDWKISHANIVKGGELVFEMTNEYE